MTGQKTRSHTFAAALTSAFVLAGGAMAGTINQSWLPNGDNDVDVNIDGVDVNIKSIGGNFLKKTVAGFTATGVAGGTVNGEIDFCEAIVFTFSAPVHVPSLSIAHLFKAANYGDQWDEEAKFTTSAGIFEFVADEATTADWDGFGTVVNNSPAVNHHAGAWTIFGTDIFGEAITSLVLASGNPGNHPKYGDFGFRELQFCEVQVIPLPAPFLMGAIGLPMAAIFARRARRQMSK